MGGTVTDENHEDAISWRDLREFRGTDLTGSYVLGWAFDRGSLLVDLDILLLPEHPFYERPRPAEKVCIRAATLEFPHCESVRDRERGPVDGADGIAVLGTGKLANLSVYAEGVYEIEGRFGRITLQAERPVLTLSGH